MIKRTKRVPVQGKGIADIQKSVKAFARDHNVKIADVTFRIDRVGYRSYGVFMVCSTPETEEEKEKRLAAAARARKAEAAERKRQERYRKEREAQVAYNTLRTHATTEKSLNDEIAAAIITLLEANPTVKKKITKAVSA